MKKVKSEELKDLSFNQEENSRKMLLGPKDRPKKISTWIMLSVQHLFAMFGATVLVPLIVGTDVISTDVALFSSGVGTLIYIICTAGKVPIYLGSSFAYIGAISSMWKIYGTSAFFGFLGVGVVYVVVALAIYFFGVKWLKKLLAPVVVGPMIMIIGLSLASNAINSIGLTKDNIVAGTVDWWWVTVSVVTVLSGMLVALLARGKMKLIPILAAIVIGFVFAIIVSTWHGKHGDKAFIDYGAFKTAPGELSTYLGVPDFKHAMIAGQNGSGKDWTFWPFLIMMPIAFVTISEHIGDHTVLGRITTRDYIENPGLHRTLLGDGLATAFAGLVGGPANTSYGENTTVVGMSRVASTYVTGGAAVLAITLSFVKLISNLLGIIPECVVGGVEIMLFGFIAANGLKILIQDKVDLNNLKNLFVVLTMLVIGIGGAAIGFTVKSTEVMFEGMSFALIVGILLNSFLPNPRELKQEYFDQTIWQGIKTTFRRIGNLFSKRK